MSPTLRVLEPGRPPAPRARLNVGCLAAAGLLLVFWGAVALAALFALR